MQVRQNINATKPWLFKYAMNKMQTEKRPESCPPELTLMKRVIGCYEPRDISYWLLLFVFFHEALDL